LLAAEQPTIAIQNVGVGIEASQAFQAGSFLGRIDWEEVEFEEVAGTRLPGEHLRALRSDIALIPVGILISFAQAGSGELYQMLQTGFDAFWATKSRPGAAVGKGRCDRIRLRAFRAMTLYGLLDVVGLGSMKSTRSFSMAQLSDLALAVFKCHAGLLRGADSGRTSRGVRLKARNHDDTQHLVAACITEPSSWSRLSAVVASWLQDFLGTDRPQKSSYETLQARIVARMTDCQQPAGPSVRALAVAIIADFCTAFASEDGRKPPPLIVLPYRPAASKREAAAAAEARAVKVVIEELHRAMPTKTSQPPTPHDNEEHQRQILRLIEQLVGNRVASSVQGATEVNDEVIMEGGSEEADD